MFQQTIIRYCKFSNSNKQFCGRFKSRINREAFDQVPNIYIYIQAADIIKSSIWAVLLIYKSRPINKYMSLK